MLYNIHVTQAITKRSNLAKLPVLAVHAYQWNADGLKSSLCCISGLRENDFAYNLDLCQTLLLPLVQQLHNIIHFIVDTS